MALSLEELTQSDHSINQNVMQELIAAAAKRKQEEADLQKSMLEAPIEIPSNVQTSVKIKVDKSLIPGAGRGIILSENVLAGSLIFKIANPLLLVAADEDTLPVTCDNCFACRYIVDKDHSIATVQEDDNKLKHLSCNGCGLLRYCDKKCQEAAWNSHHKYECKLLKNIKGRVTRSEEPKEPPVKVIGVGRVRMLVRLLVLHKKEQISKDAWEEIMGLSCLTKANDKEIYTSAKEMVKMLMTWTKTDLFEEEVLKLWFIIENNELTVTIPLLRPYGSTYNASVPHSILAGNAMDPFVSMINHSCVPNVAWTFEGKEMRVTSTIPLAAGSELYFTYVSDLGDYHGRRTKLKENYAITCNCQLCVAGPTGVCRKGIDMTGCLWKHQNVKVEDPALFKIIWENYTNLIKSGITPEQYPSHWFLRHVSAGLAVHGAWVNALKMTLQVFYGVELKHPGITMEDRLDTLYHLINRFQARDEADFKSMGLTLALGELVIKRLLYIRFRGIETAFGADSNLAWFEAVAEDEDDSEGKRFMVCMNILLGWAGLLEKRENGTVVKLGARELLQM